MVKINFYTFMIQLPNLSKDGGISAVDISIVFRWM